MAQVKRIFVVGDSGAGKGVLAEAIAKKLGWMFINADIFGCTAHLGRKLSDVIGMDGENKLNKTLTEVLEHQVNKENIVVTTDENVVCDEKARNILKKEFTVYLTASTPVLVERLSNYRPLLPVRDYSAFIEETKNMRAKLFKEVESLSLNSDHGEIEPHVNAVVEAIKC